MGGSLEWCARVYQVGVGVKGREAQGEVCLHSGSCCLCATWLDVDEGKWRYRLKFLFGSEFYRLEVGRPPPTPHHVPIAATRRGDTLACVSGATQRWPGPPIACGYGQLKLGIPFLGRW